MQFSLLIILLLIQFLLTGCKKQSNMLQRLLGACLLICCLMSWSISVRQVGWYSEWVHYVGGVCAVNLMFAKRMTGWLADWMTGPAVWSVVIRNRQRESCLEMFMMAQMQFDMWNSKCINPLHCSPVATHLSVLLTPTVCVSQISSTSSYWV